MSTSRRIKLNTREDCRTGRDVEESSRVNLSASRQSAAQPLKVPPPVSAKPANRDPHPSTDDVFVDDTDFPDFPPPPAEMMLPLTTEKHLKNKRHTNIEDELDALTDILTLTLQNTNEPGFFGVCCQCRNAITGEGTGCSAMGNIYHVRCFLCDGCKRKLTGQTFYCLRRKPLCDECYENTLEVCVICDGKISDAVIKAVGNSYHASCFACVGCLKNLDGIPFTVDACDAVYCVECYQLRFSPRCGACQNLILPSFEREETVHIVSMEKNYHVGCYKCEDCHILLYSEDDRGCYPLDGRLLCQQCHGVRVSCAPKRSLSRVLSTEL